MNPYVFIVGCSRSGTTLLKRMVDAHPLIAVTPETHWIPRLLKDGEAVDPHGRVRPAIAARLSAPSRFPKLGVDDQAVEALARRRTGYAEFVAALFELYGARQGKELVGDKTPPYARDIPTLHALWPKARFVHLIRDGRDVALSAVSWGRAWKLGKRFRTWEDEPVLTAALWWEWNVRLGREGGEKLAPDLYLEVRYEDLIGRPEQACREICRFLGVQYATEMARFHEGRTRRDPGLDAKHAWLPPTPGLRDWRSQMAPSDLERFEAAACDLLEELGYPRGFTRLSAEAKSAAEACREAFAEDVRARRKDLPARWGALEGAAGPVG